MLLIDQLWAQFAVDWAFQGCDARRQSNEESSRAGTWLFSDVPSLPDVNIGMKIIFSLPFFQFERSANEVRDKQI